MYLASSTSAPAWLHTGTVLHDAARDELHHLSHEAPSAHDITHSAGVKLQDAAALWDEVQCADRREAVQMMPRCLQQSEPPVHRDMLP